MLTLASPLFAAQPGMPIKLAATEWPPYTSESMNAQGLATEVVTAAFKRVGYQTEFQFYPWLRAQTLVKNGQLHGMGIAWYTDARAETMSYSDPYLLTDIVLIKHAEDPSNYQHPQEMEGKHFSVLRGYGYLNLVESEQIQKTVVDQFSQSLRMLANRWIDLTLEERLNAHHILDSMPNEVRQKVAFIDKPLETKRLHITVSKQLENHQRIISDFNRGLRQIIADGTYRSIIDSYHPRPSPVNSKP